MPPKVSSSPLTDSKIPPPSSLSRREVLGAPPPPIRRSRDTLVSMAPPNMGTTTESSCISRTWKKVLHFFRWVFSCFGLCKSKTRTDSLVQGASASQSLAQTSLNKDPNSVSYTVLARERSGSFGFKYIFSVDEHKRYVCQHPQAFKWNAAHEACSAATKAMIQNADVFRIHLQQCSDISASKGYGKAIYFTCTEEDLKEYLAADFRFVNDEAGVAEVPTYDPQRMQQITDSLRAMLLAQRQSEEKRPDSPRAGVRLRQALGRLVRSSPKLDMEQHPMLLEARQILAQEKALSLESVTESYIREHWYWNLQFPTLTSRTEIAKKLFATAIEVPKSLIADDLFLVWTPT